jgi:hypothetical protein
MVLEMYGLPPEPLLRQSPWLRLFPSIDFLWENIPDAGDAAGCGSCSRVR